MAEIQSRLELPRAWSWLRAWWPAMTWAGVIFFLLSTDSFSAEKTGTVLERILHWFMPAMKRELFETIQLHSKERAVHGIFCVWPVDLPGRARRADRVTLDVGPRGAGLRGRLFHSGEIHQAFVDSRTASAYDSLLDSAGAFIAFSVLWLWFRLRIRRANGVLKTT